MATEPARLNFNQRMHTIELMGARVWQCGNGRNRSYCVAMRGAAPSSHALHYNIFMGWSQGGCTAIMAYVPLVVGPSSIEAIMSLDMADLQWLLE